jgi:hypothetical protein
METITKMKTEILELKNTFSETEIMIEGNNTE